MTVFWRSDIFSVKRERQAVKPSLEVFPLRSYLSVQISPSRICRPIFGAVHPQPYGSWWKPISNTRGMPSGNQSRIAKLNEGTAKLYRMAWTLLGSPDFGVRRDRNWPSSVQP